MDDSQRIKLSEMINEFKTEETTEKIRALKHSSELRKDVERFSLLKTECLNNKDKLKDLAPTSCVFLFKNYPELLSRLITDELNINILYKLIEILKQIEDGKLDQHEASYQVGIMLKKLYIDKSLVGENDSDKPTHRIPKRNISWSTFKQIKRHSSKYI